MVDLEICANSLDSALAAQAGGARRVELCDNLADGGTTPSYGQIAIARRSLGIELYPIIRPRAGDFLYTDLEFEIMKADIKVCKDLKCDGVVFGVLLSDGRIDRERCMELIDLAKPMKVSFHRAFDMCNDLPAALEILIDMGVERVLSSGAAANALAGTEQLAVLVAQAAGRIEIMPGAGINPENVRSLIQKTKTAVVHASLLAEGKSNMGYRNVQAQMGKAADEYSIAVTSLQRVQQMVQVLKRL